MPCTRWEQVIAIVALAYANMRRVLVVWTKTVKSTYDLLNPLNPLKVAILLSESCDHRWGKISSPD